MSLPQPHKVGLDIVTSNLGDRSTIHAHEIDRVCPIPLKNADIVDMERNDIESYIYERTNNDSGVLDSELYTAFSVVHHKLRC
jgi:hypothetical protein